MLRVNNIYPAFMGEVNQFGIGVPCTFVRLAGCNLRCYFATKGTLCDTPEALAKNAGEIMDEDTILAKCKENGHKVICLTGGEPLLQDVTSFLVKAGNMGFSVVIETNGSQSIRPYSTIPNVSFIVDRKSHSSGELSKMLEDNYAVMKDTDFLKFVIDTEDDYNEALEFYRSKRWLNYNIALGTFWGSQVSYQWLMNKIHEDKFDAYLNMQTHKMACLYDEINKNNGLKDIKIPKSL